MSQVAVHLSDGRPSQTALPVEHPTSLDSGIYEVLLSAASSCKSAPFPIEGGSDSGMFCLIGNAISPCQLVYHPIISSPKKAPSILRPGDVILEIGEYQISGFTRLDAIRLCEALFNSDSKGNRPRILLKLIPPSALPSGDVLLNHFLSSHFQVGTPEFLLQEVTRNNIYQRVVPCTTRAPRPEERDGVDYQFLGVDHFLALEKSGQLIESGIYKGDPCSCIPDFCNSNHPIYFYLRFGAANILEIFPCAWRFLTFRHFVRPLPTVDIPVLYFPCPLRGVVKLTAKHVVSLRPRATPTLRSSVLHASFVASRNALIYYLLYADRLKAHPPRLCGVCLNFALYFVGNHYGTPRPDPSSTVLNVERRRRSPVGCDNRSPGPNSTNDDNTVPVDTLSQSSCDDDSQRRNAPSVPLPNGWEVIDHPEYGLFYVDHIHQKTQYEPPTQADFEEAARLEAAGSSSSTASTFSVDNDQQRAVTAAADSSSGRLPATDRFTTDVSQLRGPLTTAVLVKGPKGFGFTIVGGSSPSQPGFLQVSIYGSRSDIGARSLGKMQIVFEVKNLIPGGSAALEGTLSVGNVLVSANGVNVLGFSHDEIVSLFQSIPVGNTVSLTVSQGYTLSNGNCFDGQKKQPQTKYALPVMETYRTADRSVPFAPPELCIRRLNTSPTISQLSGEPPLPLSPRQHQSQRFEFVQVSVVKKANGFGFTLADQAQGQRVKEVIEPTGLRIGDVIVEVNDKWVKDASHVEVVQLLKACPVAKPTKFLIQRGLPNSTKKNHLDSDFNPNFTRISTCDSPNGIYGTCNDFSPTNSFYPVCQPVDCSMVQSVTSAGSSRYRSRTPGPGDSHNSRLASSGGGGGTAVMGSSSDCIYSLGESLSGLDLCRSPSLTLQSPSMAAPPGSLVPAAFGGGLKRYGGTDFDAYCMQQGLSRNNPSGSGHVLQLNPNYASLPRNAHGPPHPLGEFLVCLRREANGFGFKILGGSEEGTQVSRARAEHTHSLTCTRDFAVTAEIRVEMLWRRRVHFPGVSAHTWCGLARPRPFTLNSVLQRLALVTIGQLMPGGAAEKSGLIRPGDHLVSVNGERVYGGSHARALALLEQECDTEVTLGLWRPTAPPTHQVGVLLGMTILISCFFVPSLPPPLFAGQRDSRPTEANEARRLASSAVRHAVLHRAPDEEGFGFVLAYPPPLSKSTTSVSGRAQGDGSSKPLEHFILSQPTCLSWLSLGVFTLARVLPGSASERSRLLRVGDRLLSVNGVSVTGLRHEDVIRLIKDSGTQVALTVLPHTRKSPSMLTSDTLVLENISIPTYEHHQTRMACPSRQAVFFQVTLFRSNRGFGFSIRGGHEFNQMPLTVLRVAEGGPAHLDGRLKVGDELLQINGYTTTGMSHRRAVEIIQAGGNMISLGVRRFLVGDQKAPSFYPQSPLPFVSPPFMPPGPPNLRFPQFFTPLPVHRPAFVQKPLLSSVKSPPCHRGVAAYQSLSRSGQKGGGRPGACHSYNQYSLRRDFDSRASGDSGFHSTDLIGNRKKVSETKKESYLKDYYRNFRYVPKKGKFLMDSDSSSEESGGNDRKVRKKYNFGWSPIPNGSIESPDIYRSVASLPKDLEYLLKKADEDKLDDAEITRLRTRLEQMEDEMTRLLNAVNNSAAFLSTKCPHVNNHQCSPSHTHQSDDSEVLYSAEEN
ncbi:unnamed protein product [Mesocestoides corti]|uniref:Membrane-associated guanylate kinase, WW and PDZ domain-containing protein 3 n=1 Tax=Mesocestoides corti TaxID=53468 RepID=A0A0R3UFH4_MESCO|nr:unnamed protein product [Mesocestoides corti]